MQESHDKTPIILSQREHAHLRRAVDIALVAEREGNLPIGCVIVLDGRVIAEGANSTLEPHYHPGRHAETEALRRVPVGLWPRAKEMTCFTTMEPCTMCLGALLIHRIGRIVFGAFDRLGGASYLLPDLPEYIVNQIGLPEVIGPASPETCDELCERTFRILSEKGIKR